MTVGNKKETLQNAHDKVKFQFYLQSHIKMVLWWVYRPRALFIEIGDGNGS
jgi:hypothetical protein